MVFGTGDVLVVCNTAVLVHLQEKVVVDCLYLVFLADIATEQTCIEVRGGRGSGNNRVRTDSRC